MSYSYYEDNWSSDEFFNIIEDVMIIQLEKEKNITYQGQSRIPKGRLYNTREGISRIANSYAYVANKDREFLTPVNNKLGAITLVGDEKIPNSGVVYNYATKSLLSIKKQSGTPRFLRKSASGDIYEVACFNLNDNGVDSTKGFFAASDKGIISSCKLVFEGSPSTIGGANTVLDQDIIEGDVTSSYFISGFFGLQFLIDKQHCWTVKADEGKCKVEISCNREQIKSLLYARHEPLTKTGRLSPILHLVSSHNRRMKRGIEISSVDVKSYLRGQQTIDIGGTRFTVCPPPVIGNQLTENSLRYFD